MDQVYILPLMLIMKEGIRINAKGIHSAQQQCFLISIKVLYNMLVMFETNSLLGSFLYSEWYFPVSLHWFLFSGRFGLHNNRASTACWNVTLFKLLQKG